MAFHITFLTIFPEMFPGSLAHSVIGRGLANEVWKFDVVDLKKFAIGKVGRVDDTPYGGGAGMVIRADVILAAIKSIRIDQRPIILTAATGNLFTQQSAKKFAFSFDLKGLIIICGRYEGIDARLGQLLDIHEVAIGEYVLAGGEVAAMVMSESILRLLPNILGNQDSLVQESFNDHSLEYPQYTKPRDIEGVKVPDVLLSGDHKAIKKWRSEQAQLTTQRVNNSKS